MDPTSLADERLNRIKTAVALEAPDRVPVVLEYATFAARVTHTPLPDFLLNLKTSVEVMIDAYQRVTEAGEADAVNYGRFSPYNLCYAWLSRAKVPGVNLPDDASFQIEEKELMTRKDYDRILKNGWPEFFSSFMEEKIFHDVPPGYLPSNQPPVDIIDEWAKIGVPVLRTNSVAPPFEFLCGGRSLMDFSVDLMEIPDTVETVLKEIMPYISDTTCKKAKAEGYPAVWVGGWRTAPEMLSPKMWNRFVWPYFKQLVHEVLEYDLIPILHLDSNWNRELARFRELPRGKMIMALDGETDIFLAKELLGDHLCLMGDVPPSMLAMEDPDTVYRYGRKLVQKLGPEGFILHSGCDIPENATLENVQAMVRAAAPNIS